MCRIWQKVMKSYGLNINNIMIVSLKILRRKNLSNSGGVHRFWRPETYVILAPSPPSSLIPPLKSTGFRSKPS